MHAGDESSSTFDPVGRRRYVGDVAGAPGRQELLTALTTEHFTLQGARSQTASESASRASLCILSVSSALVALGFIGQASQSAPPSMSSPSPSCRRSMSSASSPSCEWSSAVPRTFATASPSTGSQLLQADRGRPGEALPALRARRRTRRVRERCGAAREARAVLHLRNSRRRDQRAWSVAARSRSRWVRSSTARSASPRAWAASWRWSRSLLSSGSPTGCSRSDGAHRVDLPLAAVARWLASAMHGRRQPRCCVVGSRFSRKAALSGRGLMAPSL